MAPLTTFPDRHVLYEAAVQNVDYELRFAERLHRKLTGRSARALREDFCGTAALAVEWACLDPGHVSYGVDAAAAPLAWARKNRLHGAQRSLLDRVRLVRADVRKAKLPRADMTLASNFSWWVFRTRPGLLEYLSAARTGLVPGGLLVLTLFGGHESMREVKETRKLGGGQGADGRPYPPFRYTWDQESFNPLTHRLKSSIHFTVGRRTMARAFRYDWRVWTVPETQDALADAGFRASHVFVEGVKTDGEYHRLASFSNQPCWLAIVVGVK